MKELAYVLWSGLNSKSVTITSIQTAELQISVKRGRVLTAHVWVVCQVLDFDSGVPHVHGSYKRIRRLTFVRGLWFSGLYTGILSLIPDVSQFFLIPSFSFGLYLLNII